MTTPYFDSQARTLRILNLGAGVQSTTVYLLSMEGRIPLFDRAIFADTQEEPAAVYRHLEWLQSLGGPEILVRTIGKLGDDLVAGRHSTGQRFASIPAFTLRPEGDAGITRRQCSREYKSDVVLATIRREIVGLKPRQRWPKDLQVNQYFGISRDEARRSLSIRERIKQENPKFTALFPLLDLGWTRQDCQAYLAQKVPHVVPKSACVFCPFHSDREWLRIKREDPVAWARAVEVDESLRRHGSIVNRKLDQPLFVHRSCKPLAEVNLNEGQYSLGFIRECEGVCGV